MTNSNAPLSRAGNDDKLPGTDMKEWLEKKRSEGGKPHALEGSVHRTDPDIR